jgi:hypothetical protein
MGRAATGRLHVFVVPPPAFLALERRVAGGLRAVVAAASRTHRQNVAINQAALELGWEGVVEVPLQGGDAVLREAAARLKNAGIETAIALDDTAGVWRARRTTSSGR